MDEDRAEEALRSFLEGKGVNLASLSPQSFLPVFICYYREVEFPELDRLQDQDMLLFQYGTYDWGDGRFFEIDFTRQFYEFETTTEDHEIHQQSVTFYYEPRAFEKIESFNAWSNEFSDLTGFEEVIAKSIGLVRALDEPIVRLAITVEHVC